MITARTLVDLQVCDFIRANDQFLQATPAWRVRYWHLLPSEYVDTTQGEPPMPIKRIAEKEAPERFFKRGIISSKADYHDVLTALRDAKPGEAFIVTMTPKDWEGVKKPETALGSSLRRYFESKGLAITAYQSGPMEVTVRKATALDASPKRKK